MLEIVRYNEDEYGYPCLLVLGCFDGLHIGHAELLKKAKLQAKINGLDLGVMLFTDGKGGKQLYSFDERVAFLEKYNVKFVLKIDFDDEFKKIKPLDFLASIEEKLNVKAYMSGKDFRFGQGKKGKASTLKSYAEDEENGVWYLSVKDVTCGDEKVSTTLIKSCLESGDLKTANELLGRNYSVCGAVVSADGNVLNLAYPENKFEVKAGVYNVKCTVGENEYCGVADCGAGIEIRLEGVEGGIEAETVTVEFVSCESAVEVPEEAAAELAVTDVTEEPAEQPAEEVIEQPAEEVQPEEPSPAVIELAPEGVELIDGGFDDIVDETEEIPAEIPEETVEETVEEIKEEIPEETVEKVEEVVETVEVEEVQLGDLAEAPVEVECEEIVPENGEDNAND